MRNQRLGCLSPIGLLAALITLLVIAGTGMVQGGALFSPGKLNAETGAVLGGVQSHADLGGKCEACHTAPWDSTTMTTRCLDCHTTLQAELSDPSTLHGAMVSDSTPANCLDCHTEHHGAQAVLTRMDGGDFPHEVTGFSLASHEQNTDGLPEGQSRPFECADCHAQDYSDTAIQVCAECHARLDAAYMQDHNAAFGTACLNCHDGMESLGQSFDHSRTQFALTGEHSEAACQDCHQNQTSLAALQNTATGCVDCHRDDDQHQGSLGTDCEACHTPEGWEPASFDHARSAFPLTGEHQEVECEECHRDEQFSATPTECVDCHQEDDEHQGSLGTDCAACHTTAGWEPATFDHAKSAFPLTGQHQAVECSRCHQDAQFSGTPAECISCHADDDEHQGSLGTNCAVCHSTSGWEPATFDHASSTFPLTGEHQQVECEECHTSRVFKGTPTQCVACHAQDDEHNGQFGTQCSLCHNTEDWDQATFDHSRSNFPLTGAHAAVPCERCHTDTFVGTPVACAACHGQPEYHANLFTASCDSCHSTSTWAGGRYDGPHDFDMDHEDASSCRDCHPSSLATYSCVKCHPNGIEDDDHGGDDDDDD